MKIVRLFLWAFVAIAAGLTGFALLDQNNSSEVEQQAVKPIGGPFNLIDHNGEKITQADLLGRNHAIFFGFTNCPDICPTTLLQTANWLKELDGDAEKLDFYFFSVDPERDTPEILNDYVNAFDKRITGVTGDTEEMAKTIKAYKAYSQRVDLGEGDYTMDHSATVLLFRPDGRLQGTISFDENDETALAKLRRLVKNS